MVPIVKQVKKSIIIANNTIFKLVSATQAAGSGVILSQVNQLAAKIAKAALKNKTTLKTEALKSKLIDEKKYDKIVDPKKMIYPS